MSAPLRIERFSGDALHPYLEDLAALRVQVFREFPYLYAGSAAAEQRNMRKYADAPGSVIVIAFNGARVVGASTALPMVHESASVSALFRARGRDPTHYLYLGESVLLPEYRGQGAGVRFFEEREAHARLLGGVTACAFCAVERPDDHPLRPLDYVPLAEFWRHRGYERRPELTLAYTWKDIDEAAASPKTMVFWLKPF